MEKLVALTWVIYIPVKFDYIFNLFYLIIVIKLRKIKRSSNNINYYNINYSTPAEIDSTVNHD